MSNASKNNLWNKGLLVDDALKSETNQKNFLRSLEVPPEYILFAPDYEAALEILQEDPDIYGCLIDVKIPKNNRDVYNYADEDWGISLIPKINQLNESSKILIYSAQVNREYIKDRITHNKFKNVIGFHGRDEIKNQRAKLITTLLKNNTSLAKSYDLTEEDFNFVQEQTIIIKKAHETLLEKVIDIGEALLKVKEKLQYGNFGIWLRDEFNMDHKGALRYMNVAKRFKFDLKDPDIGKLSINFVQTALFSLAEASVPQAAREEAVAIAKEGVKIDIKKAIELKAKHLTPKQESSDVVVRGKTDTQQLKDLTSRQEIIKVIPKKISKWDLGRHFLFQGDPNDAEFIKQLPHKIALNLAFPTTRNWNFKYPYQIDSTVLFSSIYQRDLEPDFFESTIVEVIKSTTDSNNVAAICYCPNIIIFQIAHDLGLRCFIAEPENVKCLKILEFFSRQKI